MALSSQNRLSLKESREKFFASGASFHSPLFQLIVLKEVSEIPRFAISISKKVAKKAHDRNLLRRQLLQLIQENLPAFPPYKYLFLPKKLAAISPYPELVKSFESFLSSFRT